MRNGTRWPRRCWLRAAETRAEAALRASPAASPRSRDRLVDIFRGLAFLIIFVSHMPGNDWKRFIPGAWGFSDATEIFVFVSGLAAGYAFVPPFARAGFGIGTLKVVRRAWQVYLGHLIMFFAIAALLSAADFIVGGRTHVDFINLRPFFDDPQRNLIGLLTLTYVPNLFDMLPMYVVILALIPIWVLLARLSPLAPLALSLCLYVAAHLGLNLPAEPWSDRGWFFNPFGWQLLFVLGVSFTAGWLPKPRMSKPLLWLAIAVVVASVPLAAYEIRGGVPVLEEIRAALDPVTDKMALGPLRLVHFLALVIVVRAVVGPGGKRLTGRAVGWVERIGQQSLIVFVSSTFLAELFGVVIYETANTWATTALVTVVAFVAMFWIARASAAMKTVFSPPARPAPPTAAAALPASAPPAAGSPAGQSPPAPRTGRAG
jgi:hypothetical protein